MSAMRAGRLRQENLPRIVTVSVVLGGLAIFVGFTQQIGAIVVPVFLALNFMIVVHPLHVWLVRHHVPRGLAAAFCGVVVAVVLLAFVGAISWALSQLLAALPGYGTQFQTLFDVTTTWLEEHGVRRSTLVNDLQRMSPSNLLALVTPLFANAWSLIGLVVVLATVLLVMTMDTVLIGRRLQLMRASYPRVAGALDDFASGVRRYWLVSAAFGLVCAALDVAGLWLLGVPLALVWGMLAFLTNFIPNVGFVIGLIPPTLLALLALGPLKALGVVAIYLAINVVVQSGIMPRYTGAAVGITPTLTFVSLLFWAWVLGPWGALLAVPMTMLWKALLVDADPNARWVDILIASDPESAVDGDRPGPPAREEAASDPDASTG